MWLIIFVSLLFGIIFGAEAEAADECLDCNGAVTAVGSDTYSLLKQSPGFIKLNKKTGELYINDESNVIRLSGANIYWLGLDEQNGPKRPYEVNIPTHFRINDSIKTAVLLGATVIRSHTLGINYGCNSKHWPANKRNTLCVQPDKDPASFNETAAHMDSIDYAIHIAKEHNVRLIIPLVDNWDFYNGGIYTWSRWWSADGSAKEFFNVNGAVKPHFFDYVTKLLNHVNNYTGLALKDDPTIMAWETGNELGHNVPKVTPFTVPTEWTNQLCNHIKGLHDPDRQQLVIDGHGTTALTVAEITATKECIDIYTEHYYPMDAGNRPGAASEKQGMVYHAGLAHAAGRAYYIGEYWWDWGSIASEPGQPIKYLGGSPEPFTPIKSPLDPANDTTWFSTIETSKTGDLVKDHETFSVNIDTFWNLMPHHDSYGFNWHYDGYQSSLYYPGNNVYNYHHLPYNVTQNVTEIRKHAYTMGGNDNPPKLSEFKCGTPILHDQTFCHDNNAPENSICWKGGYGCYFYEIQNLVNGKWVTITNEANPATDFLGYYHVKSSSTTPDQCVSYRMRGMSQSDPSDSSFSSYSNTVCY